MMQSTNTLAQSSRIASRTARAAAVTVLVATALSLAPIASAGAQTRAAATPAPRTEVVYVDAPASRRDDVLSINVLDMLDGFFNFGYEHAFGSLLSLHLGLDFLVFEGVLDDYPGKVAAVGPSLGVNLYVLGDAPAGLFLGPYVVGSWVRASYGNSSATTFGYAVGGRFGAAVLVGPVHLSAGCGALWRDFSVDLDGERVGPRGFGPRFELSLGVAF